MSVRSPMPRIKALMRSANRTGEIFSPGTKFRKRNVLCSITDVYWKRTAKMLSRSYGKHAVFRREFMQIGNIEVFLKGITNASACNKLLRKQFLKPDTIGLITTGGYSGNVFYSKKSFMSTGKRQTGSSRYCTGVLDASTGCQNSPTLVWTVSASRQGPWTKFSAVITTVIRANPTVTSLQLEGIP